MEAKGLLKKIFHPNRVSAYGAISTGAGITLLVNPSTSLYGAGLIATGYACDYVDGKLARKWNLKTVEGAKLDPLLDKAKNVLVGGYVTIQEFARVGYSLPLAMAGNFIVDFISQKQRGGITKQVEEASKAVWDPDLCHKDEVVKSNIRANDYGKAKTVTQIVVNSVYIAAELYNDNVCQIEIEDVAYFLAGGLVMSASFGIKGILDRRKNKN